MSELYQRFIPEDIDTILTQDQIDRIKVLDWQGNPVDIMIPDGIRFADAGAYFESVNCPFCDSNLYKFTGPDGELVHWWQQSMADAYAEGFFVDLNVTTPCCGKRTTLHDLNYKLNQGFFRFLVNVGPVSHELDVNAVSEKLYEITQAKWRGIQAIKR